MFFPRRAFVYAVGALTLAYIVGFAAYVERLAVDVPYWDEWAWAPLILKAHYGTLTFGALWAPHNEHRMLFPRLIALGLDAIGGWRQTREIAISLVCVAVSWCVTTIFLCRVFPAMLAAALAFLTALLLFSPGQAENWTWGFQTAWFLICTATIAAIWSLSRENLCASHIVLAALFVSIAAFSSAFGLCAIVASAATLVARRDCDWQVYVSWFVISIVIVAVYLHGYVAPAKPVAGHLTLSNAVLFFFSLLGSPIARAGGVAWTGAVGTIASAIAGLLMWRSHTAQRQAALALAPFYGLLVFGLSYAALTSLGRAHAGLLGSLTSRYSTPASLFWIGTIPLAVWALRSSAARTRVTFVRPALLAFALIASIALSQTFALGNAELQARHERQVLGLASLRQYYRASDDDMHRISPFMDQARDYMALLAAIGDGPAIDSPQRDAVPAIAKTATLDERERIERSADGSMTVTGEAALPYVEEPGAVLVAIAGDRITARGTYGEPRPTGFRIRLPTTGRASGRTTTATLCLQPSAAPAYCFPLRRRVYSTVTSSGPPSTK